MSGGSLNYFYSQLEDHDQDFDDKELNDLVTDLAELFHDREWYLSGDYGIGNWREAKEKFKKKWFSETGREERIRQYLQEFYVEVSEMLCQNKAYCKTCMHWTPNEDSVYGRCEYEKFSDMHRYESCKKYEEKRE